MSIGTILKHCTNCGHDKSRSEFYRCRRAPDGRQVRCKLCQKASQSSTVALARARTRAAAPAKRVTMTEAEIIAAREREDEAVTAAAFDVLAQQAAAAHG